MVGPPLLPLAALLWSPSAVHLAQEVLESLTDGSMGRVTYANDITYRSPGLMPAWARNSQSKTGDKWSRQPHL
ncbi:hypothetical protein C8F04DRAFT_1067065, partial [Mycena alexandri]